SPAMPAFSSSSRSSRSMNCFNSSAATDELSPRPTSRSLAGIAVVESIPLAATPGGPLSDHLGDERQRQVRPPLGPKNVVSRHEVVGDVDVLRLLQPGGGAQQPCRP